MEMAEEERIPLMQRSQRILTGEAGKCHNAGTSRDDWPAEGNAVATPVTNMQTSTARTISVAALKGFQTSTGNRDIALNSPHGCKRPGDLWHQGGHFTECTSGHRPHFRQPEGPAK